MDALSALDPSSGGGGARLPATSLRSRLDEVEAHWRWGPGLAGRPGRGEPRGQRAAAAPAALNPGPAITLSVVASVYCMQ